MSSGTKGLTPVEQWYIMFIPLLLVPISSMSKQTPPQDEVDEHKTEYLRSRISPSELSQFEAKLQADGGMSISTFLRNVVQAYISDRLRITKPKKVKN